MTKFNDGIKAVAQEIYEKHYEKHFGVKWELADEYARAVCMFFAALKAMEEE